jgi:serine/threonine-protein kinase
VLGAVLHTQADLSALPPSTPRRVLELLERCFAKDPRRRLRDAGEARLELERELAEPQPAAGRGASAHAPRARAWLLPWALCVVLAGLAAFFALRAAPGGESSRESHGARFALPRARDGAGFPELAPDGRHLVSVADDGLWLRALDQREARLLAGTEGGFAPFWAPDGRQIGFFAGGTLKRVALSGPRAGPRPRGRATARSCSTSRRARTRRAGT